MEKEQKFIGRKYEEEEKEFLTGVVERFRERALNPMEGELEKTPEEIEIIKTVEEFVLAELKFLGIEASKKIEPQRVHTLSGEAFKIIFSKEKRILKP